MSTADTPDETADIPDSATVTAHWYCTDCEHTTPLDGNIMKRCICGRYMSVRDEEGE